MPLSGGPSPAENDPIATQQVRCGILSHVTEDRAQPKLQDVVTQFCTALRMREGIDAYRLAQLRGLLADRRKVWAGRESVPREEAGYLAELYPALDAAKYLYEGEERARIEDLAVELSEAVSAAFFSPER